MCLIQGQWPIYRYQPTSGLNVGRHIGLYFGQASVESWISLGQVSAGSWTSLDRESAVTCWSVYWLTLARLSTRPYSSSIATNMLTNRQLRCQPIHENSPEFCNWSIWYLMQLICVMSNSVHHVSVDSYLVTKGKALKMRLEKQVVQVMSLTTNTPLIPYQFLTDGSLIHCRHTTDAITTDCQSICRPILDQQWNAIRLICRPSSSCWKDR